MPQAVKNLHKIPVGTHTLSLHADQAEAARNAVAFLSAAPDGQAAQYWVPDASLVPYYDDQLREVDPDKVGCVAILDHEQVELVDGRLRPVPEVRRFVASHPEGVTAAGETLSWYWTPETIPAHLEYEEWFQTLPREHSRFMCPYDLRRVPARMAPQVLHELGAHHTHVVLSDSEDLGVQLLQLFVFPKVDDIPDPMDDTLGWVIKRHFAEVDYRTDELQITALGEKAVQDWSERATVDWPTRTPVS